MFDRSQNVAIMMNSRLTNIKIITIVYTSIHYLDSTFWIEELNIMRMEMLLIFNVQSLDIGPVWEETGYFNNDV